MSANRDSLMNIAFCFMVNRVKITGVSTTHRQYGQKLLLVQKSAFINSLV